MNNTKLGKVLNFVSFLPACIIAPWLWTKLLPLNSKIDFGKFSHLVWLIGLPLFLALSVWASQKIVTRLKEALEKA
jgi:hypothetical protein